MRPRPRTGKLQVSVWMLLLALVGLITVFERAAVAQTQGEPFDVPSLMRAFEIDRTPADFVVVVDVSGSMSDGPTPPYPAVKQAFSDLIGAIPNGNWLSVVLFSAEPEVVFNGLLDSDADQAEASGRLPDAATGVGTDIGAALETTLERLERPDASDIQTVLFLTDGRHEPPATSRYVDVGNSAWGALRSRATSAEDRRSVQARAIGLGPSGSEGAELVRQVFTNPDVVSLPADQLTPYLTEAIEQSRRRQLQEAVMDEVAAGSVTAKLEHSGTLEREVPATLALTSGLAHLGVDVDLRDIQVVDQGGSPVRSEIVGGSRTVHLPPGATEEIELLIRPDLEDGPLLQVPPERQEIDLRVRPVASARAQPDSLLTAEFGVDPEVRIIAPDEFTLTRTIGMSWLQLLVRAALLALVLLLLVYVWWKYVKLPPLIGVIRVVGPMGEGVDPVKLRGTRIRIGKGTKHRLPGDDGGRIRLYTRRGRRGSVFVFTEEGSFERQLRTHNYEQVKNGTSLGPTSYRLGGQAGVKVRWLPTDKEEAR